MFSLNPLFVCKIEQAVVQSFIALSVLGHTARVVTRFTAVMYLLDQGFSNCGTPATDQW
jgi:hypothetical protein